MTLTEFALIGLGMLIGAAIGALAHALCYIGKGE